MRIQQTENLLRTEYLDLNATEYLDTKGNQKFWVWAQRPNNIKAIFIVAYVSFGFKNRPDGGGYFQDNRLVITKEFRVPLASYEYGFPAGLVNEGEDPIDAAKRELKEETGLDIKKVLFQSPYVYNSAGLSDESIQMIYVEAEGGLNKQLQEDSEDIETFLMTPTEVLNLLSNKDLKFGSKSWIIMNHFSKHGDII